MQRPHPSGRHTPVNPFAAAAALACSFTAGGEQPATGAGGAVNGTGANGTGAARNGNGNGGAGSPGGDLSAPGGPALISVREDCCCTRSVPPEKVCSGHAPPRLLCWPASMPSPPSLPH